MDVRIPLVYNPRSGTAPKDPEALLGRLPAELARRLAPAPLDDDFDYGPAIVQAVRVGSPLVVWGGDGTHHHAAKALLSVGCPVPLAAVPGGSGNGMARGLKTPVDPVRALAVLLSEGRELRTDVGLLDGEPFFNVCGTGFEAAVARDFEAERDRGFRTYLRIVSREWRSSPELFLRWEDVEPEGTGDLPDRIWSLCFALLPQYGSGLYIAPHADPADGLLQWVRLARPGWHQFVTQAPRLFQEHGRSSLRMEGRLATARILLDRAFPWHQDGEPCPARDRAAVEIAPRAFRMWVGPACPWREP